MGEPFVTKRGFKIEVQSFPHMLPAKVQVAAEKESEKLFPAVLPTYDVPLMAGGVQTFAHDPESVQTEEERKALADYEAAMRNRTGYCNQKMMQFYLLTGTIVELPDNDKWIKRQKFFGIEIPEDENELLYHYITTELLQDARDLVSLVERIMEESGIDQDTMKAARSSFRGVLGEEEDTPGRADGESDGVGETSEVDNVPTVPSFPSNGEMGNHPVPVGWDVGG